MMRVLVLSPYPERIIGALHAAGDEAFVSTDPLPMRVGADFIVSYGYRHIIREPHLSDFRDRIINLHISVLPWNRGSDPNFWSWRDGTPKGVSIHHIDAGLDTGDLIAQDEVDFSGYPDETLRTSYERLRCAVEILFEKMWPLIRSSTAPRWKQPPGGSYHRAMDKERIFSALPIGWETGVQAVAQATVEPISEQ